MPFGKGNLTRNQTGIKSRPIFAAIICKIHDLYWLSADVRGSTMLRMCPWESRLCMYVPFRSKCPWELMCCLLLGHICTDPFFRFGRQLMWTFLQKNCPLFQGYFSESSRQNLSQRSPLNQQCMNVLQTETGGLQVRKKKSLWLICCAAKIIYVQSGAVVHMQNFFWVTMSHWNVDLWKNWIFLIPFSDRKVGGYHRKEHSTLTGFRML